MNKAIDFYLRDMKGYIGELAAARHFIISSEGFPKDAAQ